MKHCFTAMLLLFFTNAYAQQGFLFEQKNDVKIVIGTDTLKHGWVGGLNSPVFSRIDLNQDGVEDLYIFDRENTRSNTFLADNSTGTWQWKPAPQYEAFFPAKLDHWVLLRDYDGDGKKDIFSVEPLGLVVYQNITPAGGPVTFGPKRFLKQDTYGKNDAMLTGTYTLPAIADIDGDGDLDILSFDENDGTFVYHFKNKSQELFNNNDSLRFTKDAMSWAGIRRCTNAGLCNSFTFNNASNCKTNGTNHGGGASILALDLDNDSDKDILVGTDMCSDLVQMTNIGTSALASMNNASLNSVYPPNTTQAVVHNYPASYFEDVDFDGVKDLLVAPFIDNNKVEKVGMSKTSWFYKNMAVAGAAPVFVYQKDNFLQDKMIDVGEWSRPVFADIDADGDQDLLIGNYADTRQNQFLSTVSLFTNVGTATNPIFKLTDPDYLQFSQADIKDIKLQFGDVDGNGSKDLIIKYLHSSGAASYVDFIPNQAQPNLPYQFSRANQVRMALDTEGYDSPLFYDMDGDGDLDLLLGTYTQPPSLPNPGVIRYYKRVGADATSYQSWKIEDADFGGIPWDFPYRDIQPTIIDMNNDGKVDMVTVANSGRIEVYSDVMSNLTGNFTAYTDVLLNTINNVYEPSKFGQSLYSAFADLDGDSKPEAVIGTSGGGVVFLKNNSTVQLGVKENFAADLKLNVYPNPAKEIVNITAAENVEIVVFDAAGREVSIKTNGFGKQHQLNVAGLKPGVYFLKIATKDFRSTGRTFVVNK
ncbi:T9SS type A sorting domain-containing protein [Adhaeribacter terreus]|uniref:T9SS type A sorting domain-containing protein n=1 Tax=Adhaeribacter terreus TaxID=529703 RepID=A0ABW0EEW9_9BACT